MKKVLLWSMLGIFLLLGAGALLTFLESPTDAYARIHKHVQAGNWEMVYGNLSSNSQQQLAMATAMADLHLKQLGVDPAAAKLSKREKFARAVSKSKTLQSTFQVPPYTVSGVDERDGVALLTLTVSGESQPRTIKMIKEHGRWTLELDLSKPNKALQPPALGWL